MYNISINYKGNTVTAMGRFIKYSLKKNISVPILTICQPVWQIPHIYFEILVNDSVKFDFKIIV